MLRLSQQCCDIHQPQQQIGQSQRCKQGAGTDEQEFHDDAGVQWYDVKCNGDDHGKMQQVKRERGFLPIFQHVVAEVQPFARYAQEKDQPGPGIDTVQELKEQASRGVVRCLCPGS